MPCSSQYVPASVPTVWSTEGWGYREGVAPLLQSQLYPPRPGQDRWLHPHRPDSKSQDPARNWHVTVAAPVRSTPGQGQVEVREWFGREMVLPRPQQAAHLAGHRAHLGGKCHPEPCRNVPHQKPWPQTLPTGYRAPHRSCRLVLANLEEEVAFFSPLRYLPSRPAQPLHPHCLGATQIHHGH